MGITYQLLFFLHMLGLALGGGVAFGMAAVGSQMPGATAETRPTLFRVADRLSMIGRTGMVLLLITGPLMFWLGFNFAAPNAAAFGIKMLLVLILLVLVIFAGINGKRAERGDRAAAQRAPMLGGATMGVFVLILLTAAIAFK